jgi:hypothetical protein
METGKRTTELIANFVKGYAKDWSMAVKECYRNELDIKFTERKKNKQSYWEWTQGPYFSFTEGHLFYNTRKAYNKKWGDTLKIIKIACEIISATPNSFDKEKKFIEGTVNFTIYKPNKTFTSLIADEDYTLTQSDFVDFLKTGDIHKQSSFKF